MPRPRKTDMLDINEVDSSVDSVEEVEVDIEENLNINEEIAKAQQMVEKASEEVDKNISNFVDDLFNDVTNKIENNRKADAEVDMYTNAQSLRSMVRKELGAREFTSISTRNIELLKDRNIFSTYGLIIADNRNDPLLDAAQKSLISSKKPNDEQIKTIAKIYADVYNKHEERTNTDGSLAYLDEEYAIKECEFFLLQKGIHPALALDIADPSSTPEQVEACMEQIHTNMNSTSKKRAKIELDEAKKSMKDFKNILNMVEESELSENEAYTWKNRTNPDVEVDQNEVATIKAKLQGPEFVTTEQLSQAIDHLADVADNLQKYDLTSSGYNRYRENYLNQKDILMRSGIPAKTVDQLIIYKEIENLQNQMSRVLKTDPQYKNFKASLEDRKKYFISKGIKEEDLPGLFDGGAKKMSDKILNEHNEAIKAKELCNTEHWKNINAFYNRIGAAFDAEHNELGTDLSAENLLETAKVLKEMSHYAKQLSYSGRVEEASHVNEQLAKIGKFLIVKGISPNDLKEINSCDTLDLEEKCNAIFEKTTQVEKVEEEVKTEEVINDKIKKIEVDIEPAPLRKNFDEIEQFDDIPQVKTELEVTTDSPLHPKESEPVFEDTAPSLS